MTKNAIKFTSFGEIRSLAAFDSLNQKLNVHVTDSGIGINDMEMGKLFTTLGSKASRTENLNQEGIGLGLTICRKIVENSGGHIQAYSDGEERGATFAFSMTMSLPQESSEIQEEPILNLEDSSEVLKFGR